MVVDTYPASEKPLQVDEEDIELEDYTDLNLASKDIVQLIQSKKDEKEALNILKTRAAENYYRNHPDQAFESSLPPNYVTFYPHKCTQVEILDHNNNFTYYITLEHYEHGHGLEHNNDGFANKPFAIYTLRSSAQNKCVKHFCKAHSPSQTPGNASPIENIEWEVRGAGDKTVKDIAVVDGDVVTVEKVIKGEKVSLTKRNETKRREGKGREGKGREGKGREGKGERGKVMDDVAKKFVAKHDKSHPTSGNENGASQRHYSWRTHLSLLQQR